MVIIDVGKVLVEIVAGFILGTIGLGILIAWIISIWPFKGGK